MASARLSSSLSGMTSLSSLSGMNSSTRKTQLHEEMLQTLTETVLPIAATACAEVCIRHLTALRMELLRLPPDAADNPRFRGSAASGTRSASPLMRALDFKTNFSRTDPTGGAGYGQGDGENPIPHEAKVVMQRVRQAVLRSGHSHEQVFHRFCRSGGGDVLNPLLTWSDFLRVIETFERDLEPSVVVRLWQALVPGGGLGLDFSTFKSYFCQDTGGLTRYNSNDSFVAAEDAFLNSSAGGRAMGRPPLSPSLHAGRPDRFQMPDASPNRFSQTLPAPLKMGELGAEEDAQRFAMQVAEVVIARQAADAAQQAAVQQAAEQQIAALAQQTAAVQQAVVQQLEAAQQAAAQAQQTAEAQRTAVEQATAQQQAVRATQPQLAASQLPPGPNLQSAHQTVPNLAPKPYAFPSVAGSPGAYSPLVPAPGSMPGSPPPTTAAVPAAPAPFAAPPPGPSAAPPAPQSGQTAPLTAAGFAGTVACNRPPEVEAFVGRLVNSLGCKIAPGKYSTLSQTAGQWATQLRQSGGAVNQNFYDDIVARIRQDSQTFGSWVSGASGGSAPGGSPPGGASPPFPSSVRPPAPLGPGSAPAPFGSPPPAAPSPYGGAPPAAPGSFGNFPPTAPSPAAPSPYGGAPAALAPHGGSQPAPFGSPPPAAPSPYGGALAPPAPYGGSQPAPFGSPAPAAPLPYGGSPLPAAPSALSGPPPAAPSPYGGAPPGAPAPLAEGPAAPQSGQSAALSAAGFAGCVAAGRPSEVETFLGRLIHSLGCKIAPGKYSTLSQYGREWADQLRQRGGAVDEAFYNDLVARIRQDSQTPGSWVAGLAGVSGQSSTPGLQPFSAPGPLGAPPLTAAAPAPLGPLGMPPPAPGFPSSPPLPGARSPLAPPGAGPAPLAPFGASAPAPLAPFGASAPAPFGSTGPAPLAPFGSTGPAPLAPPPGSAPLGGPLGGPRPLGPPPGTSGSIGPAPFAPLAPPGTAPLGGPLGGPPPLGPPPGTSSPPFGGARPLGPPLGASSPPFGQAPPLGPAPGALSPFQPLGAAPPPLSAAPPGAPAQLGPSGAAATPQSGQTAPLSAAGFAGAVANGKPGDVESFVGRLVYSLQCKIAPGKYSTLSQLSTEWKAQLNQQGGGVNETVYNNIVARIRQDAQSPGGWVTSTGATPSPSQAPAALGPAPLGALGAAPSPLGPPPGPLGSPLSAAPPSFSSPLSAPAPLGPPGMGNAAVPQSGQSASLDASGFAGAVANGKPGDVEAFIGRLTYSLGCKIAPGKYTMLSQLSTEWGGQLKQGGGRVDENLYNSIVNRIRQDSNMPGSWVTGSAAAPQPSPSQPPAGLGPLGPPPGVSAPLQPFGAAPPPAPFGQQPPLGQPPLGQPPLGQPSYGQPPLGQDPYGQQPLGQPPLGGGMQPIGGPPGSTVDKNAAAANRKAELDAKMKARNDEAAERRARAKAKAAELKGMAGLGGPLMGPL